MRALFDSIVRTLTPIIVGAVVGWIATAGIALDPEFEAALTIVTAGAFSGLYYIAVRLLETYVTPKFGWLLGLAKAPNYVPPVEPERIMIKIDASQIRQVMDEMDREIAIPPKD